MVITPPGKFGGGYRKLSIGPMFATTDSIRVFPTDFYSINSLLTYFLSWKIVMGGGRQAVKGSRLTEGIKATDYSDAKH